MSSRRLPPVVDLQLGPSRLLAAFLTGVMVLACAAVYLSGIGWPSRLALALAVAGSGVYRIMHESLRLLPGSVVRLVLMSEQECILVDRRGRMRNPVLEGGVVLSGRMAILSLCTGGGRKETLCVPADAVAADGLRRLCMHVRLVPVRRVSLFERFFGRRDAQR